MQARYDEGEWPGFLGSTRDIREGDWRVGGLPDDLLDRRVEITGPVGRKMVINALNSGANVFMADFEDATSPTWDNIVAGQVNLRDAVAGTITHRDPLTGRGYALVDHPATLMVRPRGWHLVEQHVLVDRVPVPGALFDFGVCFYLNALSLIERGSGPYFYLPKLQGHLEARLWNDVFVHAQNALGMARGTIKATVLIETLPAAFEMDEILYELREHSAGLNCGRWDYIFSFIKTLRTSADHVLPDRSLVTMTQPMMRAYTRLVVKTCHKRGAPAIGGMAAQIPIKGNEPANEAALRKVREDKLREVMDGHDGTWVAHPGLVPIAKGVFDEHMRLANQIDKLCEDVHVTAADLVEPPAGKRTIEGMCHNIRVGVLYLGSWLNGRGCVPIDHLMEDAATAEICRSQVWQWLRHGVPLENGRQMTRELVSGVLGQQMELIRKELSVGGDAWSVYERAGRLFEHCATSEELIEFLTLPAYELLGEEGLRRREAC